MKDKLPDIIMVLAAVALAAIIISITSFKSPEREPKIFHPVGTVIETAGTSPCYAFIAFPPANSKHPYGMWFEVSCGSVSKGDRMAIEPISRLSAIAEIAVECLENHE